MRRATLGNVSPAQLNTRNNVSNVGSRLGGKRASGVANPPAGAANGAKPSRNAAGSRRSSSFHGKGAQTDIETRPIGDRAFQQECARTLYNYLSTHGYENPISQKVLQTPSGKDVVSIIHFLFYRIDPNWEFKKIEEDVPTVFKRLGYPVQISRSALYAAGSPVSWPSLLAALTWLVNLLVALEPSAGGPGVSPFEDRGSSLFTEYVNESYIDFLAGDDAKCEQLDREYMQKVEEEVAKSVAETEDLRKEVGELKERLRKLKSEPSPLAALEAKQADYKEDIGKFNIVVSNFLAQKQAVEKKRDEKKEELATKKREVVALAQEIEELRQKVAAQQVNAAHVEKMLKEKEILEVNLQSVIARKQELEKTAWDHEKNASKKLRDLENVVAEFNDSCESLAVEYGEELGDHRQLEIKLQSWADSAEEVLGGTSKTVIKPALRQIIERTRKAVAEEIDPEALSLREHLFRREVAADEKEAQILKARVVKDKLEAQYKAREDKSEVAAMAAEREELEARMAEEDMARENEEAEVDFQLQEEEARLEATVKTCNEEIERMKQNGTEILGIILSKKEQTQSILKQVEEMAGQTREVFEDLLSSP